MGGVMDKLISWYKRAERGTSGDMVYDILRDWKADRAAQQELLERAKKIVEKVAAGDCCGELMEYAEGIPVGYSFNKFCQEEAQALLRDLEKGKEEE